MKFEILGPVSFSPPYPDRMPPAHARWLLAQLVLSGRRDNISSLTEALWDELPDLDTDTISGVEGGIVLREHLRRERNPGLRRKKLADVKRRGQPLTCEVCGFNFGRFYGLHGLDYIEVHHRTPLHVTGTTQTRLADLALLCSNCHRMIHRAKQWLTVEELSALVAAQRLAGVSR
jgi:5-methylcytosine-specific restriction enzyme A